MAAVSPGGVKCVPGTGTQVFTSRQLGLVMNECLCTQGGKIPNGAQVVFKP